MIVLRSVRLRVPDSAPMKRKARGREVAGMVNACTLCGWEGAPCRTLAELRRTPKHKCQAERLEGPGERQAAMVGPRFTHHDREGGDR